MMKAEPRRFNPAEVIPIRAESLPKPIAKSLGIFVEALIDHEGDERISTKPGRVELADMHEGKPVIYILDVAGSIIWALRGNPHLSMSVKTGLNLKSPLEVPACVRCVGRLPVGDYMANVIHMFHNDVLVSTVKTLEAAATGAIYRPQNWRQDVENENIWRELYYELIANPESWATEALRVMPYEPAARRHHRIWRLDLEWITTAHPPALIMVRDFILDHNPAVMLDLIRRIYELNCDAEHNFGAAQRRQLFINMIKRPICIDVRRYIVARLGDDWSAKAPLLNLKVLVEQGEDGHEDPEGCLLRATDYAINRIRARQDLNPRNPA